MLGLFLFFFFLNKLVQTVCVVSLLGANAEIKITIQVGRIFTYELMREIFQNDFEPLSKLYGKSFSDSNSPSSLHQKICSHLCSSLCVMKEDACTVTP